MDQVLVLLVVVVVGVLLVFKWFSSWWCKCCWELKWQCQCLNGGSVSSGSNGGGDGSVGKVVLEVLVVVLNW